MISLSLIEQMVVNSKNMVFRGKLVDEDVIETKQVKLFRDDKFLRKAQSAK